MNPMEAYNACSEIITSVPKSEFYEKATNSYILIRLTDTENTLYISTHIIDPGIPQEGDFKDFMHLSQDRQMAVLGAPQISKLLGKLHQDLEKRCKQASDDIPVIGIENAADKLIAWLRATWKATC